MKNNQVHSYKKGARTSSVERENKSTCSKSQADPESTVLSCCKNCKHLTRVLKNDDS